MTKSAKNGTPVAAPAVKAKAGTTPVVTTPVISVKPTVAAKKPPPAVPAYVLPRNAVILPAPKPGSVKIIKPMAKPVDSRHGKTASKHDAPVLRFPNNAPVPLPPVPTTGKPKKNQAGLSTKELEHYRELLLLKRRELVGDMSAMEREALRSANSSNLSNLPLHMADQGTDNYEQEFTLGLVEKDRNLLREINRALAKIQDGSFGICEGTAKPINKPRLEAQPWAKYGIEYARMMERGLVRR
jgi:RNA polymerase-binding protein DksA